ncbi:trichoplein keratin filament-binding protein-like [Littorina saxatilis]|uniref:Trichoplein keratin filament-binding protein n=1 Tax=Littorina saxatilis TaxID=31220 RepID=A0AAN9AJ56_9CAEN
MALPTAPKYWTNRKGLYEQAIVRHRNYENDFRQKWTETADYFQKNNVQAAKQAEWGSGLTSRSHQKKSTNIFQDSCEREIKAMKLKRRQERLKELLLGESKQYEAELKGFSNENYQRREEMKDRAEGLKSAREEKRKQIAEEKLYEHWQQNNPDIRQVHSELLKEHVVGHWSEQQEEAKLRAEQERREKEKIESQMERERRSALELDRQKEEERLRKEYQLKEHLRQQILELKHRETEAQELKHQLDLLMQQQWQMERVEAERAAKEEQRKKKDIGRALLRQHKTQMMHKSKLIQQDLEQDRHLLEEMINKEEEEITLQSARREKARADAHWMKQVIEDQLRLEKAREAEMDNLFQDEAARMWQQREGEWEKERKARQRLMDEVLEGRQEQIANKLEEVKRRQQESLERREELLRELEIASQLTRREQEKAQKDQEVFKHDLKEQVEERNHLERMTQLNLQQEEAEEQEADVEYQDFLRLETDRLRQRGYTPRFPGKKQAWS